MRHHPVARDLSGAPPKLLSLGVVYSVMRNTIISARSVAVAFILALSLVVAMTATAGATSPMGKLTAKQRVAADSQALFGSIAAKPPTPDPRADAERAKIAATQGNCTALILSREGKLVTLYTRVYKYKFVKIKKGRNKGKFQRKIVRVKLAVRIACSKQCVQVKKKKGKYQSIYTIKKIKVKVKKRGKIVTVKQRARVYRFGSCKNLPSAEELGVPVKVTILAGSYALLDFGSFTRQAAISGTLRGFIPGRFKPNTDIQVTLDEGRDQHRHDERLHRRRVQRPGVGGHPHRQSDARPARLGQDQYHHPVRERNRHGDRLHAHPATARSAQRGHRLQRPVRHDRVRRVHADVLLPRQGRAEGPARAAGQLAAGHPERRRMPRPRHPDTAVQRVPGAGPDHGQRQDDRERGPLGQGLMRSTRLILSALTVSAALAAPAAASAAPSGVLATASSRAALPGDPSFVTELSPGLRVYALRHPGRHHRPGIRG